MASFASPHRLSHDMPPNPAETLRSLAQYAGDVPSDKYMSGEVFDQLEGAIAELLGKESALYLPSGKLAQMAALKVLTCRAGCDRVALHPRSHFEEYESRAYQELWGLTAAHLGGYDRLPTPDDLRAIKEPLGAASLELPMRRLGCLLPSWEHLQEFSAVARERGIFLHMDGARLWESQPFYRRSLDEISDLFDTVYVALDKGLDALAGAVLAGPQWVIEEVKIWQRRAGGRALRSFPNVLSALQSMEERLPRMTEFHERAKTLAELLGEIEGISISPKIPHANAFLVSVTGDEENAFSACDVVSEQLGIWLFDEPVDCVDQSIVRFEVTVRGAACDLEVEAVQQAIQHFCKLLRSS